MAFFDYGNTYPVAHLERVGGQTAREQQIIDPRPQYKSATFRNGMNNKTRARIIGNQCTKIVRQIKADPNLALKVTVYPYRLVPRPVAESENQPVLPTPSAAKLAFNGFMTCKLAKTGDPELSNRINVSLQPTAQSSAFRDGDMQRGLRATLNDGLYPDSNGASIGFDRTILLYNSGQLASTNTDLSTAVLSQARRSSGADITIVPVGAN